MAASPAVTFVLLATNGLHGKPVVFDGVAPSLKSEKLTLFEAFNVCVCVGITFCLFTESDGVEGPTTSTNEDVYDRLFFRFNGELMLRRESLIGANAILLELWDDDAARDDMVTV